MTTENAKISFKCPGCKRTLKAGVSVAGKVVKCPCGTKLKAPLGKSPSKAPTPKPSAAGSQTPPAVPNPNLTTCADCSVQISKRAATCPQCGSPTGQGDSMDFGGLPAAQAAPMMAAAPLMQAPVQAAPQPAAMPGQKFCSNCAAPHNANQAICLKCGVAITGGAAAPAATGKKTKMTAAALAFLLGGIGATSFTTVAGDGALFTYYC